jgi:hypothetical protein
MQMEYSLNLAKGAIMNGSSDWYNGVVKKISGLKDSLVPVDSPWYKFVSDTSTPATRLEPLLSVARRIDQFSPDCTQCQIFRDDIDKLMTNAPETVQQGEKGLVQSFLKDIDQTINKVGRHLQKEHKLVNGGYYKSLFFSLGIIIGMISYYLSRYLSPESYFHYFFWWPLIGMGLGWVVGAFLDYRAKKEDRVLFEKEPRGYSRWSPITIIMLLAFLVLFVLIWFRIP